MKPSCSSHPSGNARLSDRQPIASRRESSAFCLVNSRVKSRPDDVGLRPPCMLCARDRAAARLGARPSGVPAAAAARVAASGIR